LAKVDGLCININAWACERSLTPLGLAATP